MDTHTEYFIQTWLKGEGCTYLHTKQVTPEQQQMLYQTLLEVEHKQGSPDKLALQEHELYAGLHTTPDENTSMFILIQNAPDPNSKTARNTKQIRLCISSLPPSPQQALEQLRGLILPRDLKEVEASEWLEMEPLIEVVPQPPSHTSPPPKKSWGAMFLIIALIAGIGIFSFMGRKKSNNNPTTKTTQTSPTSAPSTRAHRKKTPTTQKYNVQICFLRRFQPTPSTNMNNTPQAYFQNLKKALHFQTHKRLWRSFLKKAAPKDAALLWRHFNNHNNSKSPHPVVDFFRTLKTKLGPSSQIGIQIGKLPLSAEQMDHLTLSFAKRLYKKHTHLKTLPPSGWFHILRKAVYNLFDYPRHFERWRERIQDHEDSQTWRRADWERRDHFCETRTNCSSGAWQASKKIRTQIHKKQKELRRQLNELGAKLNTTTDKGEKLSLRQKRMKLENEKDTLDETIKAYKNQEKTARWERVFLALLKKAYSKHARKRCNATPDNAHKIQRQNIVK